MHARSTLWTLAAAVTLAGPAAAAPVEGPIEWIENWADAAAAAQAKHRVVFVYVHRIEPH